MGRIVINSSQYEPKPIIGYPDQVSVAPGETVQFMVYIGASWGVYAVIQRDRKLGFRLFLDLHEQRKRTRRSGQVTKRLKDRVDFINSEVDVQFHKCSLGYRGIRWRRRSPRQRGRDNRRISLIGNLLSHVLLVSGDLLFTKRGLHPAEIGRAHV